MTRSITIGTRGRQSAWHRRRSTSTTFLTVEETLDYHGGYFGMPRADRRKRAAELLEVFSLTDKRHERTRFLSGGMKRRITLARALMHRPKLLILDEPTAGVDVELRLELWHYIRRTNELGTTVLLTTHYLEEAEQLCNRIAFINHGEIAATGTSDSLADDLRRGQSRGRIPGARRPPGALPRPRERRGVVTTGQIRVLALIRREVNRFMKIKRQTLGAPLLETFLYVSIFGAALGSRIHQLHGFRYVVFVIPGLVMMAWAINAFSNNSSSILQQKFQRAIDDQLSSPASPAELLLGFAFGGFLRGAIVASITWIVAAALVGLPLAEPLILIPSLLLVGMFFAQAGVFVGARAESFDDVALYQQFVLQPLIFLGGVFYSASLLPQPFATLTRFNPGLLHDRAGALRIPRVSRDQHRRLVCSADPGHCGARRGELPHVRSRHAVARLTRFSRSRRGRAIAPGRCLRRRRSSLTRFV